MKRALIAAAACLASVALLAVTAAMFGHSPALVLRTLFEGSVGSRFAIDGTLLKSVPLLLTGLSVVIAFRAGAWNIGAEGQFIAGAIAALIASRFGNVAAILTGALAGAAWASIASLLRLWRNAPEVLTTILLNFIAIHLLGWCVNGPLREARGQYPQSDAASSSLPTIGSIHVGVPLSIVIAIATWWLLYRTTEGLRLRATGFNAEASRFAGINTGAQLFRAMAISGAISGVAGAFELLGVTHRLFERFAAGYGYSGIAVALLGLLHPLGSIASALFFAALTTGAGELQRSADISATIATFGQAIVILMVIAVSWRKRNA
jgi:general nucleoside transport system permease protein